MKLTVAEAVQALRAGKNVAFPTETVYGLGGDARQTEAVRGIFRAKGRPSDNPLIVHVASKDDVANYISQIRPLEQQLMERFWPGPLTIVFPIAKGVFAEEVTAGLDTVGIRVPDHPIALQLLSLSGIPLAAPSANRSGKPSPTTADHVLHDLSGQIEGVVDGGHCRVGLESTVVRVLDDQMHILRPGSITLKELKPITDTFGFEIVQWREKTDSDELKSAEEAPRAPGMKYPHYAPNAETTGFRCRKDTEALKGRIHEQLAAEEKVGLIAFDETIRSNDWPEGLHLYALGSKQQVAEAMRNLYAVLRQCDDHTLNKVWLELAEPSEEYEAYRNRVTKASAGRIVDFE